MSKKVISAAFALAVTLFIILGAIALGGEDTPASYAGLQNPFPWSDTDAQQAGKKVYQQSCQGCHGATGSGIARADFSAASYAASLESRPDYYFWLLSEGVLDKGMPPYKASIPEQQRWQTLAYLWSLSGATPAPEPSSDSPSTGSANAVLQILAPPEVKAGEPMSITAYLRDESNQPIANAQVEFFAQADFFVRGLAELGQALTDSRGAATLRTALGNSGETRIVARYGSVENSIVLKINSGPLYRPDVGIELPRLGPDIVIGKRISEGIGQAPTNVLHLPGAVSWLLLLLGGVIAIWSVYFVAVLQVVFISSGGGRGQRAVSRFPLLLLALIVLAGLFFALKLLVGPYIT